LSVPDPIATCEGLKIVEVFIKTFTKVKDADSMNMSHLKDGTAENSKETWLIWLLTILLIRDINYTGRYFENVRQNSRETEQEAAENI